MTKNQKIYAELQEARKKMEIACQNGSKKAWRRYGKKVCILSRKLNILPPEWMLEAFKDVYE